MMAIVSVALLVPCLMSIAAPTSQPTSQPSAKNPILRGADPDAVVVGDTVWIYPTFSPRDFGESFWAFSSKDLVRWERHGPLLKFSDVKWIYEDGQTYHGAWAPTMVAKNGKCYLYYSVGDQNVTVSRIGVAVSDSPAGPFKDSGNPMPIVGEHNKFEAIDPMVFTDPKTAKTYLYCGGSNGSKLRVFELKDDMVTIDREVEVETPKLFTEGAFLHERDGLYYLSYSHGNYRDSSYSVHYVTAPSPTGPWTYRGPILMSDKTHKGPGHHSFFKSDVSGQWYIAYHRYNNQTGDGPYRGGRSVCVDKMEYDGEGMIKPIVMTDGGVAAEKFGPVR